MKTYTRGDSITSWPDALAMHVHLGDAMQYVNKYMREQNNKYLILNLLRREIAELKEEARKAYAQERQSLSSEPLA